MNNASRPVRAVIYARISKADHNGEALAVERQIESCSLLARAREWNLVMPPLIDSDLSAFNGVRREAYEQLLGLISRKQVDAVVCWHMDRLTRRVADLVDVIRISSEANVRIATVQGDLDLSSPMGKMLATILCSVAQYEAEQKGLRHRAANEQAAKLGKRRTSVPRAFGYKADRVTACPAEAEAIRWAAAAILGGSTISAVCRRWQEMGVKPAQRNATWSRNSVTTVLKNPRLAGYAVLPRRPDPDDDFAADGRARPRLLPAEIARDENGQPVRGRWDAILDPDIWQALVSVLGDPDRVPPRGVRTLLGGLARCQCGNTVTGSTAQATGHIYRCQPATRDGRPGPHVTVRADNVDRWVQVLIARRLAEPDALTPLLPGSSVDGKALRQEAEAIKRNLEDMAADAVVGGYSKAMLQAATRRADSRLAEIRGELAAEQGSRVLAPFMAGQAADEIWDGLDGPTRRAVISELCSVTLLPAGRGARKFDPATVQVAWRAA